MHIVHLLEKLDIKEGGLGQFYWHVACEQVKLGHNVSLFALGKKKEQYTNGGVNITILPKPRWVRGLGGLTLLTALTCLTPKPDIIHGPQAIPFGWFFPILKSRYPGPVAVSVHSSLQLRAKIHDEGVLSAWESLEFSILMNTILFRADVVLPVAEFIKKELVDGGLVRPDKIHVIPPGIDFSIFKPNPKRTKRPFTVLYIGRFMKRKGLIHLLEAARLLSAESPDIRFRLVGGKSSDDGYAEVVTFISRMDLSATVTIAPPVAYPMISHEYHRGDCIVLPSYREPFARTNLEAAASGIPIITSGTGGIRDFITHGVNGYVIPTKNARAMADAIMEIHNNNRLRNTLIRNALLSIKKYDWSYIAKRYCDVFAEIAASCRR